MSKSNGWIGVDFDGTLAHYEGYKGIGVYGAPIPKMVERVKRWLAQGKRVKVFTARVAGDEAEIEIQHIIRWCSEHIGQPLEVTCCKDRHMYILYDDRAVRVERNTGEIIDPLYDKKLSAHKGYCT